MTGTDGWRARQRSGPYRGGVRHSRSVATLVLTAALGAAACSSAGTDTATGDTGDDRPTETSTADTTGTADGAGDGGAAPVPSAGCDAGAASTARTEERRDLQVDGTDRWYTVTTPDAPAGEALPVVFDFHGLSEGAQIHAGMSQYSALAQAEGFVVVFPNGTGQPVRWLASDTTDANPDLRYVDAVVAQVTGDLCVDTARLYVTGLSNGAMMTSLLACTRADTFAAFAPVAGIFLPEGCDPSRPVPIATYHGTADPILTFDGRVGDGLGVALGGGDPASTTTTAAPPDLDGDGYPATVRAWAEMNGCDPEPTDTEVTETVIHRVYDCPTGADLEFTIIVGGGHSWPGSEFSRSIESIVGPTTFDVDATADTWAFFERFTLPS